MQKQTHQSSESIVEILVRGMIKDSNEPFREEKHLRVTETRRESETTPDKNGGFSLG